MRVGLEGSGVPMCLVEGRLRLGILMGRRSDISSPLACPSLLTPLPPATLDPSHLRFFLLLTAEPSKFRPASNTNADQEHPFLGIWGDKGEGGSMMVRQPVRTNLLLSWV